MLLCDISSIKFETKVSYFNDYPLFWWGEPNVFHSFQSISYKNQIVDPCIVSDQRVKVREKAAAAAAAACCDSEFGQSLTPNPKKSFGPNFQTEVIEGLDR